jgi:cytosine/adenosine deaminase-related metal-dependent hydrolase
MADTQAHSTAPTPDAVFYMLTPRGAEAIGLDPARIGMA